MPRWRVLLPLVGVLGLAGCVTLGQRPGVTQYESSLTRLSLAIEEEKDVREQCLLRLAELWRDMDQAHKSFGAQIRRTQDPQMVASLLREHLARLTAIRQRAKEQETKLHGQMALTEALYQVAKQRYDEVATRHRSDPTLARRLETVALYLLTADRAEKVQTEVGQLNSRLTPADSSLPAHVR